jgi:sn-1 stearoyl-lipid 9-desaturase
VLRLMAMHDIRDHWQNQPAAPAYYAYDHGTLTDFWWYLHCSHHARPDQRQPQIPADHGADPALRLLDATWMLQQLPVALLLYATLGWGGVVWAACGRVVVSQLGHWLVNHICHTRGSRRFEILGSGEEGRNNLFFGALSMGEGWHNNHHAWPDSARFGMAWYELDPGYLCIALMRRLGLVWDVRTWAEVPIRPTARAL